MIKLQSKNIEDEIEGILKAEGLMSDDGIAYEGSNINSLPLRGGKDEIKIIVRNYAVIFEDDKFFYVVMNDANLLALEGRILSEEQRQFATDFSIDKLKKSQYAFLAEVI